MSADRRKLFLAELDRDLWAAQFEDRIAVIFDRALRHYERTAQQQKEEKP